MNPLEKVYRDSVDIEVAFSSGEKRLWDKVAQPTPQQLAQTYLDEPAPVQNANAPEQHSPSCSGRIKQLLRPFARFVFRLLKPVLRPVAFRIRHYLTAGMFQEIQASRELLRQEVQESRESTRQEFLRQTSVTSKEIHLIRQEFLQQTGVNSKELHSILESLRQDLSQQLIVNSQEIQGNLAPRLDRIEYYSGANVRRFAINCGQGEVLVRTEVGYILCPTADHAVLASLIEAGELELGTRLLIQRLLHPGDVFVDVGANLGMHTLAAARAMKGLGKIFAFEPYEPTKQLLEKSIWMNGFANITEIHLAAVSNSSGNHQLFLGATSGHHSLYPLSSPGGISLQPVEVPLVRLDEIILAGQQVDLLKIDVEGAELEVLDSSTAVIMGNPDIALIVEFGPSHLKRTGHSTQQWLESFTKLELEYKVINSNSGALEEWSLAQLENTDSVNLFFARKNSPAWAKAAI